MSSGIDTKHGKLLAELVVPSSSWHVQPEKHEPLYLHVPLAQSDDFVRICVTSRDDDVVFTIKDISKGGETSIHYSHIKNLDSTIRTLVNESCDKKIKSL